MLAPHTRYFILGHSLKGTAEHRFQQRESDAHDGDRAQDEEHPALHPIETTVSLERIGGLRRRA
jgi:hypothetical protein